ncbi:hypothetical protein G6F61_014123 [Rhizopus arrhizus]|nr:hypothetical protein G6F61_014123 [Rhizopus arrhizus]
MHFGNGRAHLQAGIDLPWIVGVQLLAPPLGTGGEADLTGPGVAQAAGNLRVDALQLGLGRTQGGDLPVASASASAQRLAKPPDTLSRSLLRAPNAATSQSHFAVVPRRPNTPR